MFAAGIDTLESILDLPCGYGRVLRHLRSAFPDARITACDIDRGGVDFCAATFGATPAYSHEEPAKIPLAGSYDLIWVGSLLTHLNSRAAIEFLELFRANLSSQGLLVFTIHGREVADRLRADPAKYGFDPETVSVMLQQHAVAGFGYANYPIATANVGQNYGISLASPCWVYQVMEKMPNTRLVAYTEKGWDGHQDVATFTPG